MKIELSGHYGYLRILKTILPSIAMMLVISCYTIVDGLFVSNFAGNTAFAAMNIIWPALSTIAALGLMIGTGGSALVSKILGEGDPGRASSVFTMLVRFGLTIGILCAVLSFIFMEPLVIALGAEDAMIPYAVRYGRIVSLSFPFFVLHLAFQSFYMTAEKPQLGTIVSILSGVANIGLDALFINGFDMGLTGAAIGTAASIVFSGFFPLVWFSSRHNTTHLHFVRTRTDWKVIRHSCTNGLSEYVGNIALNVVGMCYNVQLMHYIGENGVSAYGIIMYLGFVFTAVFIGYNISISQVIAYNFGARNLQEVKSLFRKSVVIILFFGVLITVFSEVLSLPLAKVFVGYDEALCSLSAHATRIYMLSFLICGLNMFVSAWFTALGNGLISAVAAFTRTLVFEMVSVFLLPLLFGIDGIWNAVNVAEVLALILSAVLVLVFSPKKIIDADSTFKRNF